MSGLTQTEKSYWQTYLRNKVGTLIKEFMEDKGIEREEITQELIQKTLIEAGVKQAQIDILLSNHKKQVILHEELDKLEHESKMIGYEVAHVLDKKRVGSGYWGGSDHDYYEHMMQRVRSAVSNDVEAELRKRYTRLTELSAELDRIPLELMVATTSTNLKAAVEAILKRLGLTLDN